MRCCSPTRRSTHGALTEPHCIAHRAVYDSRAFTIAMCSPPCIHHCHVCTITMCSPLCIHHRHVFAIAMPSPLCTHHHHAFSRCHAFTSFLSVTPVPAGNGYVSARASPGLLPVSNGSSLGKIIPAKSPPPPSHGTQLAANSRKPDLRVITSQSGKGLMHHLVSARRSAGTPGGLGVGPLPADRLRGRLVLEQMQMQAVVLCCSGGSWLGPCCRGDPRRKAWIPACTTLAGANPVPGTALTCTCPWRRGCGASERGRGGDGVLELTVPLGSLPVLPRTDRGPLGSGEFRAECAWRCGGMWAACPLGPALAWRGMGHAEGVDTGSFTLRWECGRIWAPALHPVLLQKVNPKKNTLLGKSSSLWKRRS